MPRQRSKPGSVFGHKLNQQVPADAVPLGDGRHLYSSSRREVINWEACIDEDLITEGTAPVPFAESGLVPDGAPAA